MPRNFAESLSTKAKSILSQVIYATIATADVQANPWNSPVFCAYDKAYNFYWISWTENQHSKNIATNGRAFLVVYDSTAPEGTGEGVYIQAKAVVVEDSAEIAKALHLLGKRRGEVSRKLEIEKQQGISPTRVYKATPEKVWLNSEGNVAGSYVDTRTDVRLS